MQKFQKQDQALNGLYAFIVKTSIIIEDQIDVPKIIQIGLVAMNYGYLLSFILMPSSDDLNGNQQRFFYWIAHFCRYSYYSDPQNSGGNFIRYGYSLVLMFLLIVAFYYLLSFYLYMRLRKNQKSVSLHEYLCKQACYMKILQQFTAYYGEFVGGYLYLRFYEVCLNSFNYSLSQKSNQDQSLRIINCGFSLVVLILFLAFFFLRLLIVDESLTIIPKNQKKLNYTSTCLFCVMLKLLIITLDTFLIDNMSKFYLNVVVIVLMAGWQYQNQIQNFSTLRPDIMYVEFAGLALLQTSAIILLIFQLINVQKQNQILVIILITWLIVFKIFIEIWEKRLTDQQIKNLVNKHPKYLQFLIALNIQDHQDRDQKLSVLDYILLSRHKTNCVKLNCVCRRALDYKDLITLQHLEYAMNLNHSLYVHKNTPQINSFYLHYVSFLTLIGHTSQAFQQSNILLYKQSTLYTQQSQIKIEQQDKVVTNHQSQSFSQLESGKSQVKSLNEAKAHYQMLKPNKFSFIERMKLEILQEQIKTQMNQRLIVNTSKQTNNQEDLSHSVNLFLSSELNNDNVKQKVIKAFQRKITFMVSLSLAVKMSSTALFNTSKRVAQQLLNLEINLNKLYQQFPSQKIQSVNAFYQAELMNDFFVAYKIANVTTISDEKLLKMHQTMQINLFQNNVIYMLVGLQENTSEIKILSHSNAVHKFFGYSFEQFKQIDNIQTLIPRGIRQIHSSLVGQFMVEGQSKYFREINQNLVQIANSYLKPVDFFFDINFSNQNDMTFAVFFIQQSTNNNSYLVINQNNNVTSMSQNFYQMLGFKVINKKKSNNQNKDEEIISISMTDLKVECMLPNFEGMIQKKIDQSRTSLLNVLFEDSMKFYGCDFYYLQESILIEISKQGLTRKDIVKQIKQKWADPKNLVIYSANLNIQYRKVDDLYYFTIEIEELMIQKDQKILNDTFVSLENINPSQIDKTKDEGVVLDNMEDWNQLLELDILEEDLPNLPIHPEIPAMQNYNQDDDTDEQNIDRIQKQPIRLGSLINKMQQDHSEKIKQQESDESLLIRDKRPSLQNSFIHDDSKDIFIKNQVRQQKFYHIDQVEECSESIEQKTSPKKELIFEEHQQKKSRSVNLDMQEYVMMQLQVKKLDQHKVVQIDDAASMVSSLAGMRKSKFFKKYETLNKILQSKQQPQQFKVVLSLLSLTFIISTIFSVLVLANLQTDLNRFLKEIEMLEIKANFLGSTYKFTLSTYIWAGYWQDLQALHTITVDQGKQLSHFGVYNINATYISLKEQIDSQLTNPYLEEFFTNQNIIVGQITSFDIAYRQLSLREALLVWLGFMYDYTVLIDFKAFDISIDTNVSHIVYNYVNYLTFMERFQLLEEDILSSTLQRTINIQHKWNVTIIPFAVIVAILMIITFFVYCQYIKNYERVMDVYKLIDDKSLSQDLDRLSIILGILQKDSNIMFKYQFDLDTKEKFLQNQDIKREHVQQRNKKINKKDQKNHSLQKIYLPVWKSATCFILLYTIFLGYLLLIILMTDSFLTSYIPTANLYKNLADMIVDVSGVYALREILYYQAFFFFYNSTTHQLFNIEIDKILVNINKFEQFLSKFQTLASNYLVSEQFKHNLIYYTTSNICQTLPKDYYQEAEGFCNYSMNGVALRGLLPTLNYMSTNLAYEQQINNFTSRPNLPYKEIELPLIVSEVFTVLMGQLKSGLLVITEVLISNINIICCVYLVYIFIKFVILFTYVKRYFENEFNIVKRFLLLVPQQTIFLEHHYERAIRLMIVQDNIA